MLILQLIGWFWVISGGFFLWKPHWLKGRLHKKGMRYVRKLILVSYVFAVGSIFGLAVDIGRFFGYVGALVLSVALLVYLWRQYKRMSEHAKETFEQVEEKVLKRVAWAYVAAGVLLIIGSSRGFFM